MVFQKFLSLLREEERLLLAMDRQGVADITEKKEQVLECDVSIRTASDGCNASTCGPENPGIAWRLVEEVATTSSILGQYDFP